MPTTKLKLAECASQNTYLSSGQEQQVKEILFSKGLDSSCLKIRLFFLQAVHIIVPIYIAMYIISSILISSQTFHKYKQTMNYMLSQPIRNKYYSVCVSYTEQATLPVDGITVCGNAHTKPERLLSNE